MPGSVAAGAFGELLRRYRLEAELTQEALAERAKLSVSAIQKLESGDSHPYRDTASRLVQALHLSIDDRAVFQAAAQPRPRRRTQRAAVLPADGRPESPTALNSFVGREREEKELAKLLETTRLLTLTGVGGCGKTRLAIEVARLVGSGYPDGARVIELAPVTDPSLVLHAVATKATRCDSNVREINWCGYPERSHVDRAAPGFGALCSWCEGCRHCF